MPVEPVENKIHEHGLARELGFRGGLVPGVTVYGWMTHPVVAALGRDWLERGTFAARFARPVYFDEPVTIQASVAQRDGEDVVIEARAVDRDGNTCATGFMSLSARASSAAPD